MKLSAEHCRALVLLEADDFAAAAEILSAAGQSWIELNDLALCRSMLGDAPGAMELLDRLRDRDPGNAWIEINRFYVAAADELRQSPPPDPGARIRETVGQGPENPRVTVVMPTFNRPGLIRESVESVLAQTLADWELIVVNDGGDRAVEQTLEPFLKDPRVRYVYAEHGGLSAAANVGLFLARGRYLMELDDDDVMYPEHLAAVAGYLDRDPQAQVVYTEFQRARQVMQGGEWVTGERKPNPPGEFESARLRRGNFLPVCTVCFRREGLKTAGWFNERLERSMDWEYFIRLARHYRFHRIPGVTGEFRERSAREQMSRSVEVSWNYNRNLVSFLHGFFPLTGRRFLDRGQGDGEKLRRELDRLLALDREVFLRGLELRKLLAEPYYAVFYSLGKRLADEGRKQAAQASFRAAAALRPWELKTWWRWLFS